jgi:hypothetical protein
MMFCPSLPRCVVLPLAEFGTLGQAVVVQLPYLPYSWYGRCALFVAMQCLQVT